MGDCGGCKGCSGSCRVVSDCQTDVEDLLSFLYAEGPTRFEFLYSNVLDGDHTSCSEHNTEYITNMIFTSSTESIGEAATHLRNVVNGKLSSSKKERISCILDEMKRCADELKKELDDIVSWDDLCSRFDISLHATFGCILHMKKIVS